MFVPLNGEPGRLTKQEGSASAQRMWTPLSLVPTAGLEPNPPTIMRLAQWPVRIDL